MFDRRTLMLGAFFVCGTRALAQSQPFSGLTQQEAALGISEALSVAATASTDRLGRVNGFFGDLNVRIPLPERFEGWRRAFSVIGLGGPFDELERGINRAAERTMPEAGRIFLDAILDLTIRDAIAILRGGDQAATLYLRDRTGSRLTRLITPPMRSALETSGVFRIIDLIAGQVRMRREARALRGDVTVFAVEKALDGVFYYIGREEAAIRRDPLRRTSDILRRVYGG
ncbi:MAG: DUF4197 domain-containing protein [Hydrogenophilaceae bacterium]|jgi:hypothetical protein|nr:DUF4197 domain-containing protein [Hydrogenophilaceae bacterium]